MAFLDETGLTEVWARVDEKYAPRGSAWDKIQSYETAGSYTWTAPDLFGDGRKYKIGVLVIGGGGSGGAAGVFSTSNVATGFAVGGASGRSTAFVMEVTPGTTYNVVVGAGGASASASSTTLSGNSGGTSSFNGKTAIGGSGGTAHTSEPTDYTTVLTGGQLPNFRKDSNYGGNTANAPFYNLIGDVVSCINPFEGTRILGAGGSAYAHRYSGGTHKNSYKGGKNPLNSSKGGGNGSATAGDSTAPSPTAGNEAGCGGGAAASANTSSGNKTAKSGAGAAGAVYIYVLGGKKS